MQPVDPALPPPMVRRPFFEHLQHPNLSAGRLAETLLDLRENRSLEAVDHRLRHDYARDARPGPDQQDGREDQAEVAVP